MIKIINIDSNALSHELIEEAINWLKSGGLIVYPTDTSYGLGAVFNHHDRASNIYLLKGRDEGKKLSVVIPSIEWANENLDVNKDQEGIIRQYLPGKYTFILNAKNSNNTLGIRIPDSSFIQLLTRELNQPVTATSANISGENDCFILSDLHKGIFKRAKLLKIDIYFYNAGKLKIGERSTIVDLTKNPPVVIRQGSGEFKN